MREPSPDFPTCRPDALSSTAGYGPSNRSIPLPATAGAPLATLVFGRGHRLIAFRGLP